MRTIVLALVLAFAVAPAAAHPDASDVAADAGPAAAPDITQTVVVLPPSTALPEPLEQPAAALSDVQLARKTSWPLAVWAVLAMLGKALAYGRDKFKTTSVIGKLAAWLATGKAAMGVAAIGAVGCAGYDVLVHGGTLTAALVASAAGVAGMTHSTTQAQAATSTSSSPGPTVALVLLVALGLGTTQLTGCAPSSRETAIADTFAVANASTIALETYSRAQEAKIAANAKDLADGQAQLAAWRAKVDKVILARDAVYVAIGAAAALKSDQSTATLIAVGLVLKQQLHDLGVTP